MNAIEVSGKTLNVKKETVIDSKGKKQKQKINLQNIAENIEMDENERCFVNTLIDAITNNEKIKVKFLNNDEIIDNPNKKSPVKQLNKYALETLGGGTTIPTKYGAYAIMLASSPELTIISSHEILGHGVSFLHNTTIDQNNSNGVRMEKVVRRMLNLPQYDGHGHDGNVTEPFAFPKY